MSASNGKSTNQFFYENLQFQNEYTLNTSYENAPISFPTHWHTVGEIVLAASDDSHFCVQSKEYRLNKGDILFIWPGELHSTAYAESHLIVQYYDYLLNLFPDLILMQNTILSRHHVSASVSENSAKEIAQHMQQIHTAFTLKTPMNNLRMSLSLYHILLAFYDYCCTSTEDQIGPNSSPRLQTFQTISKACCYISENCERDLSLDEVANYVGISKFHFSRSFKEYTQTNFSDYLTKQRIQHAILLFGNPDISIAEAAFQSGFGSIASFNRCFKKEKNCTPSEYRNMLMMP